MLFFSQAGEVFSQQGKPFSQKECDCDNVDTTDRTSRKVVLTNIQLLKKGADYFIQKYRNFAFLMLFRIVFSMRIRGKSSIFLPRSGQKPSRFSLRRKPFWLLSL